MIPSRARLLLWSLLLLGLGGCATDGGSHSRRFYRVQVTDPRGLHIAQWVAQGTVQRTELGYRFRAIERHSTPPYAQEIHYPEGRFVEASGPNIVVTRCGEPLWHYYHAPPE